MGNSPVKEILHQNKMVFTSFTYRIPALLYVRENKTLLAFAEQRMTSDDASAKLLVMKTGTLTENSSDVKTVEWSDFITVNEAQIDKYRTMNPCPVYQEKNKTLFLFFICVEGTFTESWQISNNTNKARLCYITSQDLGQRWSDVTDLTDQLGEIKNWSTFAVGPGHGVQMKSGRLIIPVYAYCITRFCRKSYALALYSDDGNEWKFGKMLQTKSLECEMAEFCDEEGEIFLYCNARSTGGNRVEAISQNGGEDFSMVSGSLIETGRGCQGSVVSFPAQNKGSVTNQPDQNEGSDQSNKWLLFTHPSDKRKRVDLGVYLNKTPQDPNAWSKPWIINHGPSGYSDVAYIDDGWFVCLVERGEKTETEQIASLVFSYKDIMQGVEETQARYVSGTCCSRG